PGFRVMLIFSIIKPTRFFLKRRTGCEWEIRGYEEPILFDQQADYQLDVLGGCYREVTPPREYQDAKRQTGPGKRNVGGWSPRPLNGARHPNWAGGKAQPGRRARRVAPATKAWPQRPQPWGDPGQRSTEPGTPWGA